MKKTSTPSLSLPIAAVERDTGLSKDTLRVWERRYGFPSPERDAAGERLYPPDQVERLRLVKRLLDHGKRPSSVVRASRAELGEMLELCCSREPTVAATIPIEHVLGLLKRHAGAQLRAELSQALLKQGLQRFAVDTAAPLNAGIGEAWLRGDIEVAHEHLYTEQMQNVLRSAIALQANPAATPRVLLTTLPEELHALGLLMVEAVLMPEGVSCISLGTQTPAQDIVGIARGAPVDIVALSFSAAYSARQAAEAINSLRAMLPAEVELWCGGSGVERKAAKLPGVHVIGPIEDCMIALQAWRTRAAR